MLKLFTLSILLAAGTPHAALVTDEPNPVKLYAIDGHRSVHPLTPAQKAWFRRAIEHILEGR